MQSDLKKKGFESGFKRIHKSMAERQSSAKNFGLSNVPQNYLLSMESDLNLGQNDLIGID